MVERQIDVDAARMFQRLSGRDELRHPPADNDEVIPVLA